jgi:hypothetical protein
MSERAHLSADEILYCSRDTVGSNIIITTESRKSWLVSYAETGSVRKVKVLLARYPIFLVSLVSACPVQYRHTGVVAKYLLGIDGVSIPVIDVA